MSHSSLTTIGTLVAEAIVSALKAIGVESAIEKTYLDYGQNWTWDTIIVQSARGSYQALNPRQFEQMNNGTFDYAEINDIVKFAVGGEVMDYPTTTECDYCAKVTEYVYRLSTSTNDPCKSLCEDCAKMRKFSPRVLYSTDVYSFFEMQDERDRELA